MFCLISHSKGQSHITLSLAADEVSCRDSVWRLLHVTYPWPQQTVLQRWQLLWREREEWYKRQCWSPCLKSRSLLQFYLPHAAVTLGDFNLMQNAPTVSDAINPVTFPPMCSHQHPHHVAVLRACLYLGLFHLYHLERRCTSQVPSFLLTSLTSSPPLNLSLASVTILSIWCLGVTPGVAVQPVRDRCRGLLLQCYLTPSLTPCAPTSPPPVDLYSAVT